MHWCLRPCLQIQLRPCLLGVCAYNETLRRRPRPHKLDTVTGKMFVAFRVDIKNILPAQIGKFVGYASQGKLANGKVISRIWQVTPDVVINMYAFFEFEFVLGSKVVNDIDSVLASVACDCDNSKESGGTPPISVGTRIQLFFGARP